MIEVQIKQVDLIIIATYDVDAIAKITTFSLLVHLEFPPHEDIN